MKKLILFAALAFVISSCHSTVIEKGVVVYKFREKELFGDGITYSITIEGRDIDGKSVQVGFEVPDSVYNSHDYGSVYYPPVKETKEEKKDITDRK